MRKRFSSTRLLALGFGAAAIASAIGVHAQQTPAGQSFTTLASGYTQELFATTQLAADDPSGPSILGGVAFAPNGDPWVAECVFSHTVLHRFSATEMAPAANTTTSRHRESMTVPTQGGCGLTNNPDGFLYSNSQDGVWKIDATNGQAVELKIGPRGNALGITSDPRTGHVVYAGATCHPFLLPALGEPDLSTTCDIYDLNLTTGEVRAFAQLDRSQVQFVDGIYFDPTGTYLFVTNRSVDTGTNSLVVARRPEDSVWLAPAVPQVAQTIVVSGEPDGVAFHATRGFAITNDEDGDTMTQFSFPAGYDQPATVSTFASGGFRGDLLNVGADGCVYATQGPHGAADLESLVGTRYDDGSLTAENGLVRICSANPNEPFAPGPGVKETTTPACSGTIGDFVWADSNRNGLQDGGEAGLGGIVVTLRKATGETVGTQTTDAAGHYQFAGLCKGTYYVDAATAAGYAATAALAGGDRSIDSNGSGASVTLPADNSSDLTIDFGFKLGNIAGRAYADMNKNGVRDAGDMDLSNVVVTLGGPSSGSQPTNSVGQFEFDQQPAGSYTVSAPGLASNYLLASSASVAVNLAPGDFQTVEFRYVPGSISGRAYVDMNGNGTRDGGDIDLSGVAIALSGASSANTNTAAGAFSFTPLAGGSYSVGAPSTASGYLLASAASVAVTLPAGGSGTAEFRYLPGGITGRAYVDLNKNGVRDAGDVDLSGVAIALSGASSANTNTAAGAYSFMQLAGGAYSVGAPSTASGYQLASAASVAVTLPAGGSGTADFRYVPGGITGRAYVDMNGNGTRDAGDVDLSGVAIALSGASSANTNTATGTYSFVQLAGGAYSVGAPSTASGYLLASAASVAVTLPAGGSGTADFRYVPGAITGYAYVDRNKNKVFDAGDIGIGAVPITVAGPTNATTATVANGSYAVSKLAGGNYTVSAPATAAGYPLQTPNNVAVALPAGGSKVVNFGYYETAVPTCSEVVNSTSPFRGTMTFQDSGSGIVSLVVNTNVNFSVQMPSPMPSVSAPIKTPLNIVATRIDATKSATLTVTASDLFGNSVTCDPIATTVTKLKHELGAQTMSDVDGTMHVVTIVNDTPGLNRLEVVVNGVTFMVKKLDDGERVVVDIASALHRGSNNVVTLVPHGKKGDSATVTIGDR